MVFLPSVQSRLIWRFKSEPPAVAGGLITSSKPNHKLSGVGVQPPATAGGSDPPLKS